MDTFFFENSFIDNSGCARHNNHDDANENDNIRGDAIALELHFHGLPQRPAGTTVKARTRLALEPAPGMACYLEDLEQVVRTKLRDLHCVSQPPFDITSADDFLVDDRLFDSTRDAYSGGRIKLDVPWVLHVTLLSEKKIPAEQPSGLTASALQEHLKATEAAAAAAAAAAGGGGAASAVTTNSNLSASALALAGAAAAAATGPAPGVFTATGAKSSGMLPPAAAAAAPPVVSIASLRSGVTQFPRGSWVLVATVSEIRAKSESITELHLVQPELDVRAMISAVCFNDAVSRRLRESVFKHCEVRIDRANMQVKSETDRRFQRDDHPFKIVLDGNSCVTVLKSAAENQAALAYLHAVAVIDRTNHAGGGGGAAGAVIPGFGVADRSAIAAANATRHQAQNRFQQQQQQASVSAQSMNNMPSTIHTNISAPAFHRQQQQQFSASSRASTMTGAASSGKSTLNQQQQQQKPKRTMFVPPAKKDATSAGSDTESSRGGSVLCGAPAPTRQDVENRDGVNAIVSANLALAESSRMLSGGGGGGGSVDPRCMLCGVDTSDSESIERIVRGRLDKARVKMGTQRNVPREEFMPTDDEVRELLSDRRRGHRGREWCRAKTINPITRVAYRLHPRCVHLCTEYQSSDVGASKVRLSDCCPDAECKICHLCGEQGAVAKCYDPTCDRWFHTTCACCAKGYIDFGMYDPELPKLACPSHAYMKHRKQKTTLPKRRDRDHPDGDDGDDDDEDEGIDETARGRAVLFDATTIQAGDLRDPDF